MKCNKLIPKRKRSDSEFCSDACRVAAFRSRNKSVTDNSNNANKTILSLCDYSGIWSKPYKDAGYNVLQVDIKHGQDVRLLKYQQNVCGILAAPPCTMFSLAGNRWKRTQEEIQEALSIVDACLRFVAVCNPHFWVLENPVGKLQQYLGKPNFTFHPCHYGDAYTKNTALWGNFNVPKYNKVEPIKASKGHHSQDKWLLKKNISISPESRSVTPKKFAQAFFEVNQ